ncbi:sulfotransferase family 2 domain-containing protein [Nocardioides sp.]|uniref:sulfotransferase family 2 domain-containing protein n=1 Tax=Nocardioides sp. TaxID=35761 RepID=UPI0032199E0E
MGAPKRGPGSGPSRRRRGAGMRGGPEATDAERGRAADVGPEVLRTADEERLVLVPEARQALRRLNRISRRSGRLSPRPYNLTISHGHRFVWYRVAKVGTRTILAHLEASQVELDVAHGMRLRYPTEAFDGYFKFGFVRHPLDRFVSAWRDRVLARNYFRFDDDQWERMRTIEAFAEWVGALDLEDVASVDQHLVLQSRAIDLGQVDQVGRLETFAEDFAQVCRRLSIPEVVEESRNRSVAARPEVSDELRDRVLDLYRLDFQVLGYRSE